MLYHNFTSSAIWKSRDEWPKPKISSEVQMSSRSRTASRSPFTLPASRSKSKESLDKADRNTEVAVTKGLDGNDVFTIELNGIVQRLQRLRANANRNIKSLSGQLKDDFQALAYYVQLLYDSPEYEVLYGKIRGIFGDLEELRPGTIGAYFGGCLSRNPTMGSCALTCVDAVPPPDTGFRFCDTLVLWAVWDGRSYQISPINASSIPNDRRRQAYVFLELTDYAQFPGFNEAEKTIIARFGVEEIQFVRYTQDGRQYQRLTDSFIAIDAIPVRNGNPNGIPVIDANGEVVSTTYPVHPDDVIVASGAGGGNGTVLIVVLVVILLVLIAFFGYRYLGRSNQDSVVVIDPVSVPSAVPVNATGNIVSVGPAIPINTNSVRVGNTTFMPLL